MNTRMQTRRALEMDLREALERKQLELHYQPLVDLHTNEVCGCEALLRWQHPQHGRISPADFIPVAEATGLIVSIGEWVLRQACAEAVTWPADIRVAVNLSALQFKTSLVQTVVSALANSGLVPNRLELEITETVLLNDSERTLATLRQLHDLGVQIALDDFGTGYSSLGYLRRFPFDKIKIDRCFIADLSQENPDTLAILRAMTQLGRNLGIRTTAEGVETPEQLAVIRVEGCTEMQGYLFSPPIAATSLRHLLSMQMEHSANAA
jgi:EAL domain-containing protein (putative c-di-GMP-specific phosphodiesterase class I)